MWTEEEVKPGDYFIRAAIEDFVVNENTAALAATLVVKVIWQVNSTIDPSGLCACFTDGMIYLYPLKLGMVEHLNKFGPFRRLTKKEYDIISSHIIQGLA